MEDRYTDKYNLSITDDPKRHTHLPHKAGCPPDVIAHARAVAEYAREIAVRYNKRHRNPADIELVITGALLHDIGRARSNGIDRTVAGAEIAQAFCPTRGSCGSSKLKF